MEIDIEVHDGKRGDWAVKTFTVTEDDARLFNLRAVFHPGSRVIIPGTYKKLTRCGKTIMSNTAAEILDLLLFIRKARQGGHILINGLGLGVALKAILDSEEVLSVTVIEKSKDVVFLVAKYYEKDKRVTIVCADAFDFKPPKGKRYSAVWHDIWDDICSDNLSEMTRLHRKYGRKTKWQGSWCKDLCQRSSNR